MLHDDFAEKYFDLVIADRLSSPAVIPSRGWKGNSSVAIAKALADLGRGTQWRYQIRFARDMRDDPRRVLNPAAFPETSEISAPSTAAIKHMQDAYHDMVGVCNLGQVRFADAGSTVVQAVDTAVDSLKSAADTGDDSAIAAAVAQGITDDLDALGSLHAVLLGGTAPAVPTAVLSTFATDLRDCLILRWLTRHAPMAVQLGRLLSIIRLERRTALQDANGVPLRFPVHRFVLHLDDLWAAPANALATVLRQAGRTTPSTPQGFVETIAGIVSEHVSQMIDADLPQAFDGFALEVTPAGIAVTASWLRGPDDVATAGPVILHWTAGVPVPITATIDAVTWRLNWTAPGAPQTDGPLVQTDLFTLSLPKGTEATACADPTLRITGGLALAIAPGVLTPLNGQSAGAVCGRITLPLGAPAVLRLDAATLSASGEVALGDTLALHLKEASVTLSGAELTAQTGLAPGAALAVTGPLALGDRDHRHGRSGHGHGSFCHCIDRSGASGGWCLAASNRCKTGSDPGVGSTWHDRL